MGKKTFKDSINPAMGFISQESIRRAEGEAPNVEDIVTKTPAKVPEGYKLNPLYIETKSKRLQLLIQPSLHEKLKSKAKTKGISVNELINNILQNAFGVE